MPPLRAIVVGGTSGIGQGIAQRLAANGYDVTIVGRNQIRGNEVVQNMKKVAKDPSSGKFAFMECDASLMRNIRQFSDDYKKNTSEPLDVLVVTQGIGAMDDYKETAEGIEQKLAIHYYSRIMFIESFLPLLRQSQNRPKVLNVLSAGVHSPYEQYRTDPDLKKHFSLGNAANAAGFYNDLAMDALSLETDNKDIAFIHAAPGLVDSNIGHENPWYIRMWISMLKPLGRSLDQSGDILLGPVLDSSLPPGLHLKDFSQWNFGSVDASKTSLHTPEAREFIMKHTREKFEQIFENCEAK